MQSHTSTRVQQYPEWFNSWTAIDDGQGCWLQLQITTGFIPTSRDLEPQAPIDRLILILVRISLYFSFVAFVLIAVSFSLSYNVDLLAHETRILKRV